jgi:RNA polymerase sigma-70 factor (ECF subfamily)
MTTDDPDSPLAARARSGDRAAFEELVRRTGRLVFARLYLETGDRHRAEDLTQETFLRAYRSVAKLKEPNGFRPWLLAVAHSVLLDAAKRDGRQKRTPPAAEPECIAPPADEAPQVAEAREKVLAALRSLPAEHREPLALRYLAGADYDTISAQLGLTNGTLRGLLHRGLKMLRERLPPDLA